MSVSYSLTQTHGWMVILNEKIERLCTMWSERFPEEQADVMIDEFLNQTRCLRQKYVHRCNYFKFEKIIDTYLSERVA